MKRRSRAWSVLLVSAALAVSPDAARASEPVSPSPSAVSGFLDELAAPTDPSLSAESSAAPDPEKRFKMSGRYRLAAGADADDLTLNAANADLQERNSRYLFGERRENTYDPAVYNQFLLNLEVEPRDKLSFTGQIVADPWSWVGTTGEQIVTADTGGEVMRYNLKYFGAFDSTINEIYRTNNADAVAFPLIEVQDGRTVRTAVYGFTDFNPPTGVPFTIPEHDVDLEFRPFRKLWADYTEDDWHVRLFALADQSQALTTDDPLGLSNHKDYWQQSPWLYQYEPTRFFTDGSIQRGYYSDTLSTLARDSEGNRLVLLRGASFEADLGRTYLVGTVAAPYTPWDDGFFNADNVPGAFRIKHRATEDLMVGSTYTFRLGLIDKGVADAGQAGGVDARWRFHEHWTAAGEMALSRRDKDLGTDERLRVSTDGYAFKAALEGDFDHHEDGHTRMQLSYTQMDRGFEPLLSRYSNTRDDHFWGKHLTFAELPADLEEFRLGDGADLNRAVARWRWRERAFADRFFNLFDVRHVRTQSSGDFKENVVREEATFKVTDRFTAKGLFRWQKLPKTTPNVEPFLSDYYFTGFEDPSSLAFQNTAIPGGKDPSRFTFGAALQYVLDERWTAEGFYELTNDVPDFPRGLLNGTFRDAPTRVEGILTDRLTNFIYSQGPFGAVPRYEYFTIVRERLIWTPDPPLKVIFHAAQNGNKYWAAIDDNVNHQGVSVAFDATERLTLFMDYTRSLLIDVPRMVSGGVTSYDDHHNVYFSLDYRLNSATALRAEYGVFGLGLDAPQISPYSTTAFSLPTLDTEHLVRVSLTGDF